MNDMPWHKRLELNLIDIIDEPSRKRILQGSEKLANADHATKGKWVKVAMEKFDELIPDERVRRAIMKECSCRCQDEFIEEFRNEYNRHKDIDKLIDYLHGRCFINRPERDGNIVYITKAPAHPEEYSKATTQLEKQYYFCHCEYARGAREQISKTYCYCGAGWCQRIWEGILEQPIRIEIVKSVLWGDDVCQFAVYI